MRKHFGCFCPVGCNLSCPQLTAHQLQLREGRRVGVHLPECDGDETRLGRAKCFGMCQPCVFTWQKRICICLRPEAVCVCVAWLVLYIAAYLCQPAWYFRSPYYFSSSASSSSLRLSKNGSPKAAKAALPPMQYEINSCALSCLFFAFFCLFLRITPVRVYVCVCA